MTSWTVESLAGAAAGSLLASWCWRRQASTARASWRTSVASRGRPSEAGGASLISRARMVGFGWLRVATVFCRGRESPPSAGQGGEASARTATYILCERLEVGLQLRREARLAQLARKESRVAGDNLPRLVELGRQGLGVRVKRLEEGQGAGLLVREAEANGADVLDLGRLDLRASEAGVLRQRPCERRCFERVEDAPLRSILPPPGARGRWPGRR